MSRVSHDPHTKEVVAMARMIAIHEIELKPGVQAEELERFFRDEVAHVPLYPGWKTTLLKGDRGSRAGKYAVLFEIDSLEARNRYVPTEGADSEEAKQWQRNHPEFGALVAKWGSVATMVGEAPDAYTDYVEV
jgi:hypothetical protein